MKNEQIRNAMKIAGMKSYEVSDVLKISESTFFRWMRHEMPEEKQLHIIQEIKNYAERRGK